MYSRTSFTMRTFCEIMTNSFRLSKSDRDHPYVYQSHGNKHLTCIYLTGPDYDNFPIPRAVEILRFVRDRFFY